jgi:hypothetical protein
MTVNFRGAPAPFARKKAKDGVPGDSCSYGGSRGLHLKAPAPSRRIKTAIRHGEQAANLANLLTR